jgi:colicin import membrane protein
VEAPPAPPPKPVADVAPEPPVKPKPPEKPKDPPPEKPKAEATPTPPAKEKTADAPKTPVKLPKPFDLTAIAKLVKTADATPTGATQGLPDQHAERMSPSLSAALDSWLKEEYMSCWSPPPGIPEGESYIPAVHVEFNADGSLSGQPVLINPPRNSAWRPHAESAVRATLKCNPLHVPAQFAPYYQQWKSKTIHFDPQDAMG